MVSLDTRLERWIVHHRVGWFDDVFVALSQLGRLGAIWVLISWSVLLMPYPFLDALRDLLDQLPTVMTLATVPVTE